MIFSEVYYYSQFTLIYLNINNPRFCDNFTDSGNVIQKFVLSFNCFKCFKLPNESGSALSLLLFKFSLIKDVRLPIVLGIENKLFELDNVIFTPHISFYSEESLVKLRTSTTLNVIDTLFNNK